MKARHEFDSDESYNEYLRTYFFAIAIIGVMTGAGYSHVNTSEETARLSLYKADALIKALNETKDESK